MLNKKGEDERRASKPRRFIEERRIRSQLPLIYSLAHEIRTSKRHPVSTLFPLLDAITQSTESVLLLAKRERLRDIYAIGRMVYETTINACFILAKGPPAAERAWRHARQKGLRDLKRFVQFGEEIIRLDHSHADLALNDPAHQKLLAEFALKDGREDRNWTPENLNGRLKLIRETFGRSDSIGLAYGQFLYRHSSEMLHGTLFSSIFVYGATDPAGPPRTVGQLRAFRREQLRLVMLLLGVTLDSLIRILSKVTRRDDIAASAQRAYTQRRLTKR